MTYQVQNIPTNEVRYEFGPCLYTAYIVGFVQMVLGACHLVCNPFRGKDDSDNEDQYSLKQNEQYYYNEKHSVI